MSHLPTPQPIDSLKVIQYRSGLPRTTNALTKGRLVLGFVGGSITEDNGGNWPDSVASWFQQKFPEIFLTIENAAIGATGSNSGCIRLDKEIIARGCDLCFVEYAVNDRLTETAIRNRSREGLIRKLLAAGIDVVLVYTYCQPMYADMEAGIVPPSIAEFETIATYYGLSSVWSGLHALREVRAGKMKWHQWLPDKLHPSPLGSHCYGEAVVSLLEQALKESPDSTSRALPEALHAGHWQQLSLHPLENIQTQGPWVLKRIPGGRNFNQVLETHSPGASLRIPFTGRGLALVFQYGNLSSEFTYRLDGGEWIPVVRERFDWAGDRGRVDPFLVSDQLPSGGHLFEMKVTHGDRPECAGTECRLAHVAVIH